MSDDNQISEDTIASIVDAAQNIAADSDAMRQSLMTIGEALQPVIKQAGIRFSGSETWQIDNGAYGSTTFCIGVRKNAAGEWIIGIESTNLYPREWDGSRWIGYDDPFNADAYSTGNAKILNFNTAGRHGVENAIRILHTFIIEYAAELKRRHKKYAELREMAERIANDIQEMN